MIFEMLIASGVCLVMALGSLQLLINACYNKMGFFTLLALASFAIWTALFGATFCGAFGGLE